MRRRPQRPGLHPNPRYRIETNRIARAADDAAIADLESAPKMTRDMRDDKYVVLNDKRSKVGMGVAGDPAYGDDSPHNARNGLRPQVREEVWSDTDEIDLKS